MSENQPTTDTNRIESDEGVGRRETIQQCASCGAMVIGQFDGGCPGCGYHG